MRLRRKLNFIVLLVIYYKWLAIIPSYCFHLSIPWYYFNSQYRYPIQPLNPNHVLKKPQFTYLFLTIYLYVSRILSLFYMYILTVIKYPGYSIFYRRAEMHFLTYFTMHTVTLNIKQTANTLVAVTKHCTNPKSRF